MLFRKELFKRIVLVVVSIIATVCILEIIFRIFNPIKFQSFLDSSREAWRADEEYFNTSNFRPSITLGYEMLPNSLIGTNSLGMLDKERLKEKPKDVYRIICLGDSITATSYYMKTNSAYPSILEKLLNEGGKREKFEVWNCGIPGYSVIQCCRALKEKWLRYYPDMVIIGFCLNDFDTTPLIIRKHSQLVGYFPHKEILPKVSLFLLRHSALYRFIVVSLFFSKKDNNDLSELARSSLREVKELLLAKKTRFLIVILGLTEKSENYSLYYKRIYAKIKRIITDYNIESVDMVNIFENNDPESLRESPGDEIHFNRKGREVIAKGIFEYLNQSLDVEKK